MKNKKTQINWKETITLATVLGLIIYFLLTVFEVMEIFHWVSGSVILSLLSEDISSFYINLWTSIFYGILAFSIVNKNNKSVRRILKFLCVFMAISMILTFIWIGLYGFI